MGGEQFRHAEWIQSRRPRILTRMEALRLALPAKCLPNPSSRAVVYALVLLGALGLRSPIGNGALNLNVLVIHRFPDRICCLDFNPVVPRSVVVSSASAVVVLDAVRGSEDLSSTDMTRYPVPGCVTYTPDGTRVITSSGCSSSRSGVLLQDAASGVLSWRLEAAIPREGEPFGFGSLAVSPDGQLLVAANCPLWGLGYHVWDLEQLSLIADVQSETGFVAAVAFSPNGSFLAATTTYDGGVYLWDTATWDPGECLFRFGPNTWAPSIAISADSNYLAVGSEDGRMVLLDLGNGAQRSLEGHTANVASIAFSPDERFLVSVSLDGTLAIWETTSGCLLHALEVCHDGCSCVDFSSDGTFLAVGSEEGEVVVYDFAARDLLPLPPDTLISRTYADIDGDQTLETIEIYLAAGRFYDDRIGWCGDGEKWEGEFDIRVRRGSTVLFSTSLDDVLGSPQMFFRSPEFELSLDDFNGDGNLDFTLAQYAGCNGGYIQLMTVNPEGHVHSLVPQAFYAATFTNTGADAICVRPGRVGFTYYDMEGGRFLTRWYVWEDGRLILMTETSPFCSEDPKHWW